MARINGEYKMISLKSISGAGGGALGLRPLGAIQMLKANPVTAQTWFTLYNSTTFVQVHSLSIGKATTGYTDSVEMRVTDLDTGVVWSTVSTTTTTAAAYKALIGHSVMVGSYSSAAKISPSYVFEGGLKVEIRNTTNTSASLNHLYGQIEYTVVEER